MGQKRTPEEIIATISRKLVRERCTYVSVNKRALGIAENFKPIRTSDIFVTPQLIQTSIDFIRIPTKLDTVKRSQINVDELIRRIDARITELEAEEAAILSKASYSLHEDTPAVRIHGRAKENEEDDYLDFLPTKENHFCNVVVTASAGSGKSILLDRLALWLARESTICEVDGALDSGSDNQFKEWLNGFIGTRETFDEKIPLLLRCRDIASKNYANENLPWQIAMAIFQCPANKSSKAIELLELSDPSQFVILVDGLDELPKNISVAHVYDALLALFGLEESDLGNRFSVFATTRDTAMDNETSEFLKRNEFQAFEVVALNKMNRKDRGKFVYSLARSWYICQCFPENEACEKAELLKTTIESDWTIRFRNFLRSPLELTLCLVLFSNVENLPSTEHALYSKYVNSRLRWRRGSTNADDLLLLLSYCASRTAYEAKKSSSFDLRIPKDQFLKWLETSYSILGTSLESFRERGFKTREDAALHDLNELVNVHGVLSISDGMVSFEHRRLQVFLAENGLITGACPRGFSLKTYAGIYESKKKNDSLGDDWATLFAFFVQDSRVGDQALRETWDVISANADPVDYTDQESEIFLAILMDGRIANAAQINHLESLLQVFCSRRIMSGQLDGYRKISTDGRYTGVIKAIEKLYREDSQYEYCFTVATLDIFGALRQSIGANVSEAEVARILRWPKTIDGPTIIRLLHRLEMLLFFRQVDQKQLEFSKYFFDDGSSDCNDAVRSIVTHSLKYFCTTSSHKDSAEIARTLNDLSEIKTCRSMICDTVSSGAVPLFSLLSALERQIRERTNDADDCSESISIDVKRMLGLLASLSADECLDDAFDSYSSEYMTLHVKRHYIETMRWAAEQVFRYSSIESSREFADANNIDAMLSEAESLDMGLAVFLEPLKRACTSNKEKTNKASSFPGLYAKVTIPDTVEYALKQHESNFSVDIEDLRIAAASVLNAARFNIIIDPGALMIISKIFDVMKRHSESDTSDEFGYPGETLNILCNENNMRIQIRGEVRKVLDEEATRSSEPQELEFTAVAQDGRLMKCEALFMFDSPETGKSYIVYTDHTRDEDGNTKVYASIYDPNQLTIDEDKNLASLELSPIESSIEWEMIETILDEIQASVEE
ncbi:MULTISPECIES: DUF1292 domain-containing protein [Gordonibacter]|uniref:DUF1292 domain-containing protein n=1 Tax=Gordonibacter faecis TaxID=3047475 RepID=A0ABT7DL41_9ACTN|nr:DUF1292 domain-containing protein [Gordonibacter sp. KGMB12511]MDJ1650246.1 DUF1292 domain-containing protein [Gordonibacter sp. KGMB12511]